MIMICLNLAKKLKKFDSKTITSAILFIIARPLCHYRLMREVRLYRAYRLLSHQPLYNVKYLNPRHLAHSLTISQRRDALAYNLAFIRAAFYDLAVRSMVQGEGLTLWSFGEEYKVVLKFEHFYTTEGELTLQLRSVNQELYALSFSFVSGKLFALNEAPVVFVTRLQGGRGVREAVENAIKVLKQTHPRYILVAALVGSAKALCIDTLIGVSASDQVCRDEFASCYSESYETFFQTLGATLIVGQGSEMKRANYCLMQLPLAEKDIMLISSDHRSRTKKKRDFRRAIADEAFENARKVVLHATL